MTDPCPCCQRLMSVMEDHGCALACGDDEIIVVSRTVVQLAAITTDLRHGLTSVPHARGEYAREAAARRVLPLSDPVRIARRMTR